MNVALYVRVSTADQNCELQLRELQDYVSRQGWAIHEIYQDMMSGAKSSRPGINKLLEDAWNRRFDCVLVWKLDRFGRSLLDCLNNIGVLERGNIRLISVTQGIDTDHRNPASKFLLQVLGAAGEFERELIIERSRAGQKRYKQDFEAGKVGKTVHSRSGKDLAPHRPKKFFDREEVVRLHGEEGGGLSIRQIAKRMRISVGTVFRVLSERSRAFQK